MCIRALDYMPPVESTFGDYLRAIITADYDLASSEDRTYRVAFLDAFRRYGIYPDDVGTLSVETLLWPSPADESHVTIVGEFVAKLSGEHSYWNLPRDRQEQWQLFETWKRMLHGHLSGRVRTRSAWARSAGSRSRWWRSTGERPRAHSGTRGPNGSSRSSSRRVRRGPGHSRPDGRMHIVVDADSGRVRYPSSA